VIHDAKYIDKVYEVVDLRGLKLTQSSAIRAIKKRIRELLMSVHRKQSKPDTMTEDERKVFELFENVDEPNKYLNAAHRKRLRFQLGQRDRFLEGLHDSGRYLPQMEEIFRKEGLPVELTRLPFVESSFNIRARSKVGASGIWQFMRSTGKLFLRINEAVDERNDPIRATEAAARLLKLNFESLKSWPLAVTAYNHGRKGMMRAVRRVGSEDLEDVVSSYRSRSFGFASGNFFTSLLAAIEVHREAEKHFGEYKVAEAAPSIEVPLPHYISIHELARFLSLDLARLRELNPALSSDVFAGRLLVPKGYRLRLPFDKGTLESPTDPESAARLFVAGYSQIPDMFKLRAQKRGDYGRSYFNRRINSGKRGGQ
jgi:membrane-bound lytic murein transglycosylase D